LTFWSASRGAEAEDASVERGQCHDAGKESGIKSPRTSSAAAAAAAAAAEESGRPLGRERSEGEPGQTGPGRASRPHSNAESSR